MYESFLPWLLILLGLLATAIAVCPCGTIGPAQTQGVALGQGFLSDPRVRETHPTTN